MNLQQKLVQTLEEVFDVERVDALSFTLRSGGDTASRTAIVRAPEDRLAAFADANAADALIALGPVDDDVTGRIAAVGLLAVHIEESIASTQSSAPLIIDVKSHGLDLHIERDPQPGSMPEG